MNNLEKPTIIKLSPEEIEELDNRDDEWLGVYDESEGREEDATRGGVHIYLDVAFIFLVIVPFLTGFGLYYINKVIV